MSDEYEIDYSAMQTIYEDENPPKYRGADYKVRRIVDFTDTEMLTKQEFEEDTDVNVIVDRYRVTGILPNKPNEYGNENEYDFQQRQIALANLRSTYFDMSEQDQAQFQGVDDYLDAVLDPDRQDELVDKGIIEAPPEPGDPTPPADPEPNGDDDNDDDDDD